MQLYLHGLPSNCFVLQNASVECQSHVGPVKLSLKFFSFCASFDVGANRREPCKEDFESRFFHH